MNKDGDQCLIHFNNGENGPLTQFSEVSFQKFLDYRKSWLSLDGEQSDVAKKTIELVSNEDINNAAQYGYHRCCYSKFTNKTLLLRAENRHRKRDEVLKDNEQLASEAEPCPRKILRSSVPSKSSGVIPRNQHVLPPVCIICQKEKHFFYNRKNYKKELDKLVNAETVDGGKLRQAAEKKDDKRILIQINGKDCIAIEVKYHKRCYSTYTSFLSQPNQASTEHDDGHFLYKESFDIFCSEFVQKKLIDKQKIYYTKRIFNEFVKTVSNEENCDASGYRVFRLKNRIKERYPQLVFCRPSAKNKCEMVFVEDLSQKNEIYENQINLEGNSSLSESDSEDDGFDADVKENKQCHDNNPPTPPLSDLYCIAMFLRDILCSSTNKWYSCWPPLASDITGTSVKKVVPPLLFNFLAWMIGASNDPEQTKYVDIKEDMVPKLFSIAQDLVYIASKGRSQTPKSLALAMAIRQISGCSVLINILSGLGHCVSLSSVMAFDTALAQLNVNPDTIVPKEFIEEMLINLVFDNIDFGEEAAKQTHVTNGIITQKICDKGEVRHEAEIHISKMQRTIKAPENEIVPYNLGKRKTPTFQMNQDVNTDELIRVITHIAKLIDTAYIAMKFIMMYNSSEEIILPGWTGFNTLLFEEEIPEESRVGYLPIINANPTEYPTIYAILKRSIDIANKLKLKYAVVVFDEGLYAKIQQVRWKEKEFYDRLIIRLGEFHVIMSYLSAVSKLFADGGLKDVLIESGVISEGRLKGVLSGKHYNRALYCHKIVYEALQRLRFEAFLNSLEQDDQEAYIQHISRMAENFPQDDFVEEINETSFFDELCTEYEVFIKDASLKSKTFAFWSMYINMIGLLLMFLRATRQVNWTLHLSSFRAMLPWFFISDRTNYSRYGTAYWLEMMALDKTHPGCSRELSTNFAVQRQSSHSFSAVACDQTIEQTANRDAKTKGGLIGISLNRDAIHRWMLSQSERGAITRQCKLTAGLDIKPRVRKDLNESKCKSHEKSVTSVMSTITTMLNPFDTEQQSLVNLASGAVLEDEVADHLLNAEKKGEKQFSDFVKTNVTSKEPDIFSKISRNKIKTFSSVTKNTTVKDSKGQEVALKVSRNLFARLLIIARSREIDLKNVLSYSLSVYPLSLATPSGTLGKTAKAKLLHILENTASEQPQVDVRSFTDNAIAVDAMATIQAFKGKFTTFCEFADKVFDSLVKLALYWKAKRLDFVCDTYPKVSIKNSERTKRAEQGVQKVQILRQDQQVPKQWKKYLSSGENKESLIKFLYKHWSTYESSRLKGLSVIYMTVGEHCFQIVPSESSENNPVLCAAVEELHSNHEEADTRLLLHANHAAQEYNRVIVKSPDTDVLTLCVAAQYAIGKELFFLTGTGNNSRCISVKPISEELGESTCKCLPGFHAFSGSDCISSFHGKGKGIHWKTLMNNPEFVESFGRLGSSIPPRADLISDLNKFVCVLYGDKSSANVDECRFNLFKSGKYSEDSLPPNSDCLLKHAERANYQAAIWNGCLTPQLDIPSPNGNGWSIKDEEISIVWMVKPPAPDSILEFVNCRCRTGCESRKCSCHKNNLKCTDLCSCVGCHNCASGDEDESDSDTGSQTSDDDDYDDDESDFE